MSVFFTLAVGLLIGTGVFLLLSRTIVRVVLGLTFIAYAVNLAILTASGLNTDSPPLLTLQPPYADPLPQALVLTAIVIGFATTALLLTVALRAYQVAGHNDVAAFGDNLAREPYQGDGIYADPEHLSPDHPEWEAGPETSSDIAEVTKPPEPVTTSPITDTNTTTDTNANTDRQTSQEVKDA